jgi:hypothetical protein
MAEGYVSVKPATVVENDRAPSKGPDFPALSVIEPTCRAHNQ